MQLGSKALPHEVLLEGQCPLVSHEARADLVVAHRQHARGQSESPAQFQRWLGQAAAAFQHLRAQHMRGEVAVADAKPSWLAQTTQRFERLEGVPFLPIAHGIVKDAGEAVDRRIDVWAHEKSPELVVVCGVRDHCEVAPSEQRLEARGQLRAAGASREDDRLHRKTSSAAGRTRSWPRPSPTSSSPRMTTTGARAVLRMTRPAADARSSATARTVACISLPASSGIPRRSIRAGSPATPSATLTMPSRHGRPNVSDTITPTSTPVRSWRR